MIFYSALGVLVLIIFIRRFFIVVPHQNAYIKERLGKYAGTLNSGFHFIVPFIEKIAYRHTLKEEVLDVAPQICITKDNVQVEVDGILYLQVLDPQRGSYGIDNYRFAAVQLAQTSMRSEIGKIDLDQTFVEREVINDAVVASVDAASEPWGIKVKRYEIRNILPTKTVMNTMEQQMKAEREKRAEIYHSDGERTAMINRSEGDKKENINRSEGEKMKRINEAEGVAKEIELVAEATAEALKEIASSIKMPGGQDAVRLRIAQQYIRRFGEVLERSHTTVVPLRLAMIQGFFEGVSKSMEGLRKETDATTNIQKENI